MTVLRLRLIFWSLTGREFGGSVTCVSGIANDVGTCVSGIANDVGTGGGSMSGDIGTVSEAPVYNGDLENITIDDMGVNPLMVVPVNRPDSSPDLVLPPDVLINMNEVPTIQPAPSLQPVPTIQPVPSLQHTPSSQNIHNSSRCCIML
jgi:hypothetical protein